MSDDNPYRAPTAPLLPNERQKRPPLGPFLIGISALGLAAIVLGVTGFLISLFTLKP